MTEGFGGVRTLGALRGTWSSWNWPSRPIPPEPGPFAQPALVAVCPALNAPVGRIHRRLLSLFKSIAFHQKAKGPLPRAFYFLVPCEGLEPPRLSAPDPKSGVSANFTSRALLRENVLCHVQPQNANHFASAMIFL